MGRSRGGLAIVAIGVCVFFGATTSTSVPALFAAGAIQEGDEEDISLLQAFKEAFWGLLAPVIILGGLYSGIFTPTEAAVVAVFYSLLLGTVSYRTLTFKGIYNILVDASETSAVVMLIVAFAGLFSWAGSTIGILDSLAEALMGIK